MVLVFTLGLIAVFFLFLFARESFNEFAILKIIGGFSIVGLAVYLALGYFKGSDLGNNIIVELFIGLAYFLLLIEALGGIDTLWFAFVYVLIIIACLFSFSLGLAFIAISSLYFIYHVLISTTPASEIFTFYGNQIFTFFIVAILGILIGLQFRKILTEKGQIKTVAKDITIEKSTNEALLSNIGDGIYAVNQNREIILFNPEAEKLIQWKQQDAIGLPCKKIFNFKNDQNTSICENNCPVLAVWKTGQNVVRDDLCAMTERNKSIKIEGSYSPIKDNDGKMTGAICVFRDVTKKKETERMRSEFVSTASHELRTPITAISGYVELAMNPTICKTDEKAKTYLEKARTTATGMSNLIQNLLIVTKIEDKRLEKNITDFPLRDLIEEVVEVFQRRAQEKKIQLIFAANPDSTAQGKTIGRSLEIRADREQLREVLNNLLENAIKFTSEGGVTISTQYDNDFATICIEDTGVGIPEESQKHLFEKFYQADNTATRNYGGSGLGLFITRSIVESFGGQIWLESKEGKGTHFYFTVPRAK